MEPRERGQEQLPRGLSYHLLSASFGSRASWPQPASAYALAQAWEGGVGGQPTSPTNLTLSSPLVSHLSRWAFTQSWSSFPSGYLCTQLGNSPCPGSFGPHIFDVWTRILSRTVGVEPFCLLLHPTPPPLGMSPVAGLQNPNLVQGIIRACPPPASLSSSFAK